MIVRSSFNRFRMSGFMDSPLRGKDGKSNRMTVKSRNAGKKNATITPNPPPAPGRTAYDDPG